MCVRRRLKSSHYEEGDEERDLRKGMSNDFQPRSSLGSQFRFLTSEMTSDRGPLKIDFREGTFENGRQHTESGELH